MILYYTTYWGGGGGREEQNLNKGTEQSSSKSGNKPASLLHPNPSSITYFSITCPHQILFNFRAFLQFPKSAWDQRRLPYHTESHSCNTCEKLYLWHVTTDIRFTAAATALHINLLFGGCRFCPAPLRRQEVLHWPDSLFQQSFLHGMVLIYLHC